jgi:hypothetical protein
MPPEFQFFLLCLSATQRKQDHLITLNGIVTGIVGSANEPIELTAAVGMFLPRPTDATLRLVTRRLDQYGELQPIRGIRDMDIEISGGEGVVVVAEQFLLPTLGSGVHSTELIDTHGLFGASGKILATYRFPVKVRG